MAITPEIISGFGGAVGVGIFWAARAYFSSRSENGKLTKKEHDERCDLIINPLIKRLGNGDEQFKDLRDDIKRNHEMIMEHLLKLAEKK